MMSTPDATSVERVRDHLAIATFRTTPPICMGIRRLNRSHDCLPDSVFFHRKKAQMVAPTTGKMMYQYPRRRFDAWRTYCGNVGRSPPSWSKILTKIGT